MFYETKLRLTLTAWLHVKVDTVVTIPIWYTVGAADPDIFQRVSAELRRTIWKNIVNTRDKVKHKYG